MSQAELINTVVSAGFVLFMVAFAAIMGFRRTAKLDDAELARLAEAEGARVEAAAIDVKGRAAVAKLDSGKVLIAKVMADGVSARVLPLGQAHVRAGNRKVSVTFGDLGYPSLNMQLENPPTWLKELGSAP